jgi:hypothetical protein
LYEKGKGMSIITMKQALDALNTCDYDYDYEESMYKTYDSKLIDLAIEALSQAIAEAEKEATLQEISDIGQEIEQEPVAWVRDLTSPQPHCVTSMKYLSIADTDAGVKYIPVYAAPPKREWVGLTDEEMSDTYNCHYNDYVSNDIGIVDVIVIARAIEAKLRERNT